MLQLRDDTHSTVTDLIIVEQEKASKSSVIKNGFHVIKIKGPKGGILRTDHAVARVMKDPSEIVKSYARLKNALNYVEKLANGGGRSTKKKAKRAAQRK